MKAWDDEAWAEALATVARSRKWPAADEPGKLGALVCALSDAYNESAPREGARIAGSANALAARLGFSFLRDVPKAQAAVRELVATGALVIPADRPLHVLDVGAGLGATTWGLVRALADARMRGDVEAVWIDDDAGALEIAQAILRAAPAAGDVRLKARAEKRRASSEAARGPFDVVLLGQVLSELDPEIAEEERVAKHVALVEACLASLDPAGSLVIVEPALRDRTRHLHRVRDALLAKSVATVFAPCLHAAPCPALAAEGDWCHEDRDVDLPDHLVPVARAAGLRWQGLTFAYLVLRRDGRTLRSAIDAPPGAARLRVVSSPLVSKGKRELFVCGELASASPHLRVPARVRAMLLDRERTGENAAWGELARGDLVVIDPSPDANKAQPRIARGARVTRVKTAVPGSRS